MRMRVPVYLISTQLLTYLQHNEQSSSCLTPNQSSCINSWTSSVSQDDYVAWAENFTLGLQHGFTIANNNKVQSYRAQVMSGQLSNGTDSNSAEVDV
jgi:hypothetical protein